MHALRSNYAAVWDVFAAVDAMDMTQADAWYFDEADFMEEPKQDWLIRAASFNG